MEQTFGSQGDCRIILFTDFWKWKYEIRSRQTAVPGFRAVVIAAFLDFGLALDRSTFMFSLDFFPSCCSPS